MIRLLLIALFLYVAWSYYSNPNRPPLRETAATILKAAPTARPADAHKETHQVAKSVAVPPTDEAGSVSAFECDGRVQCSQMTSRAEAKFFSKHCPNTKMDGDRDGVPCEDDERFHRLGGFK